MKGVLAFGFIWLVIISFISFCLVAGGYVIWYGWFN